MKKFLSLVLVLVMTLTLSVNVFAETNIVGGEGGGALTDAEIPVQVTTNTTPEGIVYRVDIEWQNLNFTYTVANSGTWDPANHKYTNVRENTWSAAGTVTLTNHSNAVVTVNATCTKASGNDKLTVNFAKTTDDGDDNKLASGVGLDFDSADTIVYTVSMEGAPTTDGQVATIAIKLQ